jgi:site-specific DNA-methyltransferase (adenine-specific)/modification methylase
VGNATLYLGDCLEILPSLDGIDAVITDPPYGINWQPRVNHQDQPWVDDKPFDPSPFLRLGSFHLFWGAQYFADKLPLSESWATWVKRPINFDFSKDGRTYATTELAWSDWGKARFIAHVWDGGMRAGQADNRTFVHPSQKPVEVMEWCIPETAQTILDPYMGSGTTGVACVNMSRKFIGVEIEPQYFEVACERIARAQQQQRLFA